MKPADCQARQYGSEMHCAKCGLVWDTNDPEPPECQTDRQIGFKHLDKIKEVLHD